MAELNDDDTKEGDFVFAVGTTGDKRIFEDDMKFFIKTTLWPTIDGHHIFENKKITRYFIRDDFAPY